MEIMREEITDRIMTPATSMSALLNKPEYIIDMPGLLVVVWLSKVWIDVLTPKQALFFWPLAERLKRRGLEPFITSRRYEQLDWILRLLKLDAVVLGRFGGGDLRGKLATSTERQRLFLRYVNGERPVAALSSGSIEMMRVCFGLQISHYLVSDTPHSPVNALCAPPSSKIFTPFAVNSSEWTRWGVRRDSILRYRALDPLAWIIRWRQLEEKAPKPSIGEYALVRVPEYKASYLSGRGLDETVEVVRLAAKIFSRVLVLLRYRGEASALRRRVPSNVELLEQPVLALPFIKNASIVLSGGGTIAQEAALLGKPVIMFYPGETPAVHRFLASRGLLRVVGPRGLSEILQLCEELTRSRVRRRLEERARRLVETMEDPTDFIERALLTLLRD